MKENRKKRILVFHPGTIGDILACLPVYDYIRQQHPDGHIIQLCLNARQAKVAEELLLPTPYIDEVRYGEITTGSVLRRSWNLFRVALQLRSPDNDALYFCCGGWPRHQQLFRRYMLFLRFANFKRIFGGKDSMSYVDLSRTIPRENELLFRFLFGKDVSHLQFDIALNAEEQKKAQEVWNHFDISKSEIPVAIGIGGKKQVCLYPTEQYIDVIRQLIENNCVCPILVGGLDAKKTEEKILKKFPSGKVKSMLEENLSLRETIALLQHCRLYCGNDTGSMHMAAAAKIPCVGVFAAHTYRGKWSPLGEKHTILRHDPPCAGCLRVTCMNDPASCIASITPEEIVTAVRKYI